MTDNLIREGETGKAVSFKPGAYDRDKKIQQLGIELPKSPGKVMDELIERAQQLQQAQDYYREELENEKKEIGKKQEALGLE